MIEAEHIEGGFDVWRKSQRNNRECLSDLQKAEKAARAAGLAKGGYIGPRTFFGVDPGGGDAASVVKGWSWRCACKSHFVIYGSRAKCATCGMEAQAPYGF